MLVGNAKNSFFPNPLWCNRLGLKIVIQGHFLELPSMAFEAP
ncbi:MAG: hypothetical protein ACI97A_001078 [Planctomycetota bacterium]|jgi:hypothetical protein